MIVNEKLTLSALNRQIRGATEEAFPEAVWVIAEIMEMQVNRSGHCYLELVEKSETDDTIVAKNRATIWSFKYRMIRPYFESTTGALLQPGIKVLVRSEIIFHEIYGLSLNIIDIDPSYTMGDMARRKKEVMDRLRAAGVMQMNKELQLNVVPQRIAVISSETAAGFGDFIDSLVNNSYGFSFKVSFFPAIVQGDSAEKSIISALDNVFGMEDKFDVVVLLRGGGSQADLDCFNGYELAMNIAQFPVPVLTGIGHDRDETIADLVAWASLKTPTAAAEFLIDKLVLFSDKLAGLQEQFDQQVRRIIQKQSMVLQQVGSDVHYLVQRYISSERILFKDHIHHLDRVIKDVIGNAGRRADEQTGRIRYIWRGFAEHRKRDLHHFDERIRRDSRELLNSNRELIKGLERSLELIRPEKVLSRGYSITYAEGRAIKSLYGLKKGDKIKTMLTDGTISSEIVQIKKRKTDTKTTS